MSSINSNLLLHSDALVICYWLFVFHCWNWLCPCLMPSFENEVRNHLGWVSFSKEFGAAEISENALVLCKLQLWCQNPGPESSDLPVFVTGASAFTVSQFS